MGTINVGVQTSPGSGLEETDRIMDEIEAAIRDIWRRDIIRVLQGKDTRHNHHHQPDHLRPG